MIDTNIWVSALLNPTGPPARVLTAYLNGRFELITSEYLLSEANDVLGRPHFARKYGITRAAIDRLIALLRNGSEIVPVVGAIRICRDPKDDAVIETAINGRADVLVSRDDDLKRDPALIARLAAESIAVVSVRRFLELLDAQPSDGG